MMQLEGEGADQALIREAIRRQSERGERLVAKLRAAMHTAIMLGTMIGAGFLDIPPAWRPISRMYPFVMPVVLVTSWGWLWFVHTRPYRRSFGVLSVSADVLVLVAVMFVSSLWMGDDVAGANLLATTPPLMGLFFVVAAAGVRHDPVLCVLAGAIAIAGFGVAIALAYTATDLTGMDPSLAFFAGPPLWIGRAVIIGFTAALSALAARNARRMAESAGALLAEQARITQLFGRYVDPEVAKGALARGAAAETREVTVLFTDLRGFTTMTERMSPSQTLDVLNAHYGAIVPVVHQHGGTVNKFIGDAIMATFGAPMSHPDHALRAVRAAQAMLSAMDDLNRGFLAAGEPVLDMGIGIATGQVVVGSLGDLSRVEYAVIGDTVNTASRLEAMNKQLSTRLLLSQATRTALGDAFAMRALGEVSLRGKTHPVEVYTLAEAKAPSQP